MKPLKTKDLLEQSAPLSAEQSRALWAELQRVMKPEEKKETTSVDDSAKALATALGAENQDFNQHPDFKKFLETGEISAVLAQDQRFSELLGKSLDAVNELMTEMGVDGELLSHLEGVNIRYKIAEALRDEKSIHACPEAAKFIENRAEEIKSTRIRRLVENIESSPTWKQICFCALAMGPSFWNTLNGTESSISTVVSSALGASVAVLLQPFQEYTPHKEKAHGFVMTYSANIIMSSVLAAVVGNTVLGSGLKDYVAVLDLTKGFDVAALVSVSHMMAVFASFTGSGVGSRASREAEFLNAGEWHGSLTHLISQLKGKHREHDLADPIQTLLLDRSKDTADRLKTWDAMFIELKKVFKTEDPSVYAQAYFEGQDAIKNGVLNGRTSKPNVKQNPLSSAITRVRSLVKAL